jgi:hypothetical protein
MDHVLLDIGQPKEWWSQVVGDARRVKRVPLLIFSRNRAKDFIMLPYTEEMYYALEVKGNDVMRTQVTIKNIRDELQEFDVIVTTYETFTSLPIEWIKQYAADVEWDAYAADYQ